ncbi:unnamed protein product, partial [Linum tenue]
MAVHLEPSQYVLCNRPIYPANLFPPICLLLVATANDMNGLLEQRRRAGSLHGATFLQKGRPHEHRRLSELFLQLQRQRRFMVIIFSIPGNRVIVIMVFLVHQ